MAEAVVVAHVAVKASDVCYEMLPVRLSQSCLESSTFKFVKVLLLEECLKYEE